MDLIPPPPVSKASDDLLHYVSMPMLTQGPLAGTRFGECMLPWQERIIRWLPHVDEIGVKCGKGSGKSAALAYIALGTLMQWAVEGTHHRALVAVISPNVPTSKIIFNHVLQAILSDQYIKDQFKTNVQDRKILHIDSGIEMQIIPPNLSRTIGLRTALICLDEVHECAQVSEFEEAFDQLVRGSANWPDAKLFSITTSPPGRAAPYYTDWLARLRSIRDGKVKNDRVLPVLFEFPVLQRPDLDAENPEHWYFGAPSLQTPGHQELGTMSIDALKKELKTALDDLDVTGTQTYHALLSQRLGIELEERQGGGLTVLSDLWPKHVVEELPEPGTAVYIGMDPSSGVSDPFAVEALYSDEFGTTYIKSRQWLTRDGYNNSPGKLRRVYDKAIAENELFLRDSDTAIEADVFAYVAEYAEIPGVVLVVGGDAAGLAGFKARISEKYPYTAVPQGWQLMASFEGMTGTIHGNKLKHAGQPLLSYNIKNLRISGSRLVKADVNTGGAGWDKIDGAMAMLSAYHLMKETPVVNIASIIG